MDTRTRISRELASGAVVCSYSDPQGYGYLSDPEKIGSVEGILAPLGVRICMTSNRNAFFAAEDSPEDAKIHLKASYESLAREARRIEEVAEFMLNVFPDGQRLTIGQIIELPRVLEMVAHSNALSEMLAQVTANQGMTSNTTVKRVSNLLARLAKDGYLVSLNSEKETYCVTGKIEYMWDVIENFVKMIPDLADQLPEPDNQGDLFQ